MKLTKESIETFPTTVIISTDSIFLRTIKTPVIKGNPSEMIYWELVKMFPGKIDSYYWNYRYAGGIIEDNVKKIVYKVELIIKIYYDGIVKTLAERRIKPVSVISEETALETILNINKPDILDTPYSLIYFDSGRLSYNYFENNILKYKRYIENISDMVIKYACEYYKIEPNEFNKVVDKIHILPYSQTEQTDDKYIQFSNLVKQQIKLLKDEILKTENFLKTNFKYQSFDRIYLFGVFGCIAGIEKMLSSELNRKVETYNASVVSDKIPYFSASILSYSAVTAELSRPTNEINFLSPQKKIFIEQTGSAINIFIKPLFQFIAALILITLFIMPYYKKNNTKNIIEKYKNFAADIEKMNNEISGTLQTENISSIDKKFKNIIDANNYDYYSILGALGDSMPGGVSLTNIRLIKNEDDPAAATILQIEGWSSAPALIPKFILNIDKTGLFQNINLSNTRREFSKNSALTKFEIFAVLKEAQLL